MGELWNIHINIRMYGSSETDEEKISELNDRSEEVIQRADFKNVDKEVKKEIKKYG